MASANKRLNERLAKYNHMYDSEEEHHIEVTPTSNDETDNAVIANGSAEIDIKEEPVPPAVQPKPTSVTNSGNSAPSAGNSNENNNVIEPERVPIKKMLENVSVHVNSVKAAEKTAEGMRVGVATRADSGNGITATANLNPSNHVSCVTSAIATALRNW